MRKFLLIFCFFTFFSYANLINSIAVVVDKEPITTYEIEQAMRVLNLNRNEALNVLINDKMELSQMKRFGVVISEFELDEAINRMLAQNGGNKQMLEENLKQQGKTFSEFRANFKKDLEKRKLFDAISSATKIDYTDIGAKQYFENNKDKFSIYESIDVKIYSSTNQNLLESLRATKKTNLTPNSVNLNPNNADPRLLAFLSTLNIDEFSPVIDSANGYDVYQVKAKQNAYAPQFEQIKDQVLNTYINEQRQNFIKDYFEKLRSKISIEYVK